MNRVMKDSGIEWIGNIPQDWKIIKNKYVFKRRNNKVAENYINYQLLSLTKKGIIDKDLNETGGKLPASFSTYQEVQKDDIVLCLFDLDVSAVFSGISKYHGMISSAYGIFKTNQESIPDYYDYLFQIIGFDRLYLPFSKSLRKTINEENFNSIYTIKPPYNEQIKIVDFLNKSTMTINNIITQTHQSIEELKKYRQSVITEAVTKGLNPNVEMKDSGIEPMVNVPKHWKINKIKYLFELYGGLNITKKNLIDTGIPVINYGEIHSKYGFHFDLRYDVVQKVDSHYLEYKNSLINQGDFIFADTSEDIEGSGNFTCYLNEEMCFAGSHTIILKSKKFINYFYFSYLFESLLFRSQIQKKVEGIKVYSITQRILKSLILFEPPAEEQQQIVEYLDDKVSTIDNLIKDKTKVIEELENYKKSLIYEYVTGKKEV